MEFQWRISTPALTRQELAFSCNECDGSYKTRKVLRQHRRDKHHTVGGRSQSRRRQDLPFPCPDCREFSYPTAKGLLTHRVQYCSHSKWRGRKGRRDSFPVETGAEKNVAKSSLANDHQSVSDSGEVNKDECNNVGSKQNSQELEATISAMDDSSMVVTVSPSMVMGEGHNVEASWEAPNVEARQETTHIEARVVSHGVETRDGSSRA